MKKIIILVLFIVLSSCKVFNPYGSWITQKGKKTYQIKKAPDDDIKLREISSSNSDYDFYKRVDIDSIVLFSKRSNNVNQNSKLSFATPNDLEFFTQDRGEFKIGSSSELAFRISKKEEPTPEILNEAIAREINKKYPIKVKNWQSGRINGRAHRFEKVLVRFSKSGILTVNGVQTVNECRGFTGRVFVYLRDFKGNILAECYFSPNGLDPKFPCKKNKRSYDYSVPFKGKLTEQELKELIVGTHSLEIRAERTGSPGRIEKSVERLKQVTNDLSDIGADIAKIYALL